MSFNTALTGLDAASKNLEVISNNIANSNTSGFKRSRAEFADVYAASDFGGSGTETGKGVQVTTIRQQMTQGDITYTDNALDLAISGGGMFRIKDANGGIVYSRAGMFGMDREGYLANATEQRLTGYQVDDSGNVLPTLGEIKIDTADLQPKASENVEIGLNLDQTSEAIKEDVGFKSDNPKSYNFTTGSTIYDSQGGSHVVNYYFRKEENPDPANPGKDLGNKWTLFIESADTGSLVGDTDGYSVEFENDGTIKQITDSKGTTIPGQIGFEISAEALGSQVDQINLKLDIRDMTQYDAASGVNRVKADGYSSGRMVSLDIDKNGVIFGRYTNGQSKAMGQVALANFANTEGLRPVGDSSWAESYASGAPAVGAPGSASLGFIQSSALESSNVDVTEELVDMIGAQRAFQANAQIISVNDELTQTVINMRR